MLQIQLRHPWAKIFGAATSAIGTKRTNSIAAVMSASDPKRTQTPTIRAKGFASARTAINKSLHAIMDRRKPDRIPQPDLVRRFRDRRPAKAVGDAKYRVVGPHVGLQRPATIQFRVIAREAELIVTEYRDARSDVVFEPD